MSPLHYSNLHVDCLYHHGNSCNSNTKYTISEYVMDITQHTNAKQHPNSSQRQRKRKNNNEGFDKLHIILLIHVYALAQILYVK